MNIVSKTGVVAGDVTESPQKKKFFPSLPFWHVGGYTRFDPKGSCTREPAVGSSRVGDACDSLSKRVL